MILLGIPALIMSKMSYNLTDIQVVEDDPQEEDTQSVDNAGKAGSPQQDPATQLEVPAVSQVQDDLAPVLPQQEAGTQAPAEDA